MFNLNVNYELKKLEKLNELFRFFFCEKYHPKRYSKCNVYFAYSNGFIQITSMPQLNSECFKDG